MRIKGGLLLWFTHFPIRSLQVVVLIHMQLIKIKQNHQLGEELQKQVIKKNNIKKRVSSGFKDNNWATVLTKKQV